MDDYQNEAMPVGAAEVAAATQTLQRYKAGKAALDRRLVDNELWFRMGHWKNYQNPMMPGKAQPSSGWLFNSIANKHADAMDNYPEPNVLPRAADDEATARALSSVLPVVLEQADYEQVYSDCWWRKLKQGTGVTGVFWDPAARGGVGDIAVRAMNLLMLYWEPGVADIQDSPDFFSLSLEDTAQLTARYPQLAGHTAGVNEEELADLSRDIVHVVGRLNDDSFRPLQTAGLQGSSLSYRQSRIEELKEISGNRDMTQGGTTGGVTAASAIAALQEAGSKLSRDMLKSAYRAFSRQCYLMIELMRQFYDEQRIFRIVGPSGENQFLPFSAAALRPQPVREVGGVELGSREPIFDIVVSAAKKSTFSRLSQNETAKECYQLGFFDPANADAALAALEMMDFEGIEKVRQRVRQNGTLAQKLAQLQQAVPPQTGTGGAVLPGSLPVAAAARAMNVKL